MLPMAEPRIPPLPADQLEQEHAEVSRQDQP
jgi:hypothetical protein